jgi:hypothetical protein
LRILFGNWAYPASLRPIEMGYTKPLPGCQKVTKPYGAFLEVYISNIFKPEQCPTYNRDL